MTKIGIITVSDRSSRGEREDLSGPEIKKWATKMNFKVESIRIVPDEMEEISNGIIGMSNSDIDLILTTGGTGCAPRDVTPEATKNVIEKEVPGFGEVMRRESLKITSHGMLSRATAGIRKNSLIVNLPGSPKAVKENLEFIEKAIPHAIKLIKNKVIDCALEE